MGRTPKSAKARPTPDQATILAFIASAPGKIGKREIARHFGLHSAEKVALKAMLKQWEREGLLDRRRKVLARADHLPAILAAEITGIDAAGELIAAPAEWPAARGEAPRIVVMLGRQERAAGLAPGIGDRVLLRLESEADEAGTLHRGRVIKRLAKPARRMLGVFRANKEGGGGRLIPIEKRGQPREIDIPAGSASLDAQDGDLVAVEFAGASRPGQGGARIRERLGSVKSERAISLIAIHTHEIPHVFPPEALAEAQAAKPASLRGREDWRAIPLITIDPIDAKDHDDAVHAQADADRENPGGFVLHIAIADVAYYVRPGSALDREAYKRGNSVYFPDRVVPMLPERISNDLCSLRPGETRAALGLRVVIDARGAKKSHSFHRVLMRSAAKLAYEAAQAAIEGRPDPDHAPLVEPILTPLFAAYEALKRAREAREPLDLDLPERKLVLDISGHVQDVITPLRLDAHRLIEEFMILANVAAAETLEKAQSLLLYRAHDNPSLEKMQGLRDFLETIGISLPKQGAVRPDLFNRILARVKDSPNAPLVNEIILRSQAQAEYSPENIGHFGLNLRRYAHFTSPIRRYADLIVHRGLIRALSLGQDGLPDTTFDAMKAIGEAISAAERRAMAAERETSDRLIAQFLADQVGASFSARITGVTRVGLFVRLEQSGADGFIPAASLGQDYFRHDEKAHALTGASTGESFRLGDAVRVKLVEAAPMAGALRFEMLSEGRYVKVTRGKTRGKPAGAAFGGPARLGEARPATRGGKTRKGKRG